MRNLLCIAGSLGILCGALALWTTPTAADDGQAAGKIFELRIYKANPGKLEALNARFRDNTNRIFKKHGIEIVGYWVPTDGPEAADTLYYFVSFPSVEAQKKAWKNFMADPEWKKVKDESEKDGVLVKKIESKNFKATDYSPIR